MARDYEEAPESLPEDAEEDFRRRLLEMAVPVVARLRAVNRKMDNNGAQWASITFEVDPGDCPRELFVAALKSEWVLACVQVDPGTSTPIPSDDGKEWKSTNAPGREGETISKGETPAERYRKSSTIERIIIDMARCDTDPEFQGWIERKHGVRLPQGKRERAAATKRWILDRIGATESRNEALDRPSIRKRLEVLDASFKTDVGRMASPGPGRSDPSR